MHLPSRGIHNGTCEAAQDGHGQEDCINGGTFRKPKGDVGQPQCLVHTQFITNERQGPNCFKTGAVVSAHGHGQWIDDDILARNAHLFCPIHNFPCNFKTFFRLPGDALIVHGEPDDRCTVILYHGKNLFQLEFLTIDGIDEGLSFINLQTGLQGLWER